DPDAIAALLVAKLEQFFDVVEGEAEILCALDEADDADGLVWELAIARVAPRRTRQQPAPFVVPERLDIDACLLCCGSDAHVLLLPSRGLGPGAGASCDGRRAKASAERQRAPRPSSEYEPCTQV